MSYKLHLRLVDCLPEVVVMDASDNENDEDAKDFARYVFESNSMVGQAVLYKGNDSILFIGGN